MNRWSKGMVEDKNQKGKKQRSDGRKERETRKKIKRQERKKERKCVKV